MKTKKTERRWKPRLENIESLFLPYKGPRESGIEYFPCVYIEANVAFNDIRTGYRGAVKLARALKIYDSHATPGWSEEIIQDSNVDRIRENIPRSAQLRPLPEFVDAEFINSVRNRYIDQLTRKWKKVLYHNSELNIYSGADESREEFITRCREQFLGMMREELDRLRVIFNRMQEQLKEKYLGVGEAELSESAPFTMEANDRDIYSRYTERVALLFLNASSSPAETGVVAERMDKKSELEERLIALTAGTLNKITLLRENYEKKAELVDEYVLRPNMKNIHCERSCIIWAPVKPPHGG